MNLSEFNSCGRKLYSYDAFGNAIGNSIVSAQVNSRNERVAEQERLSAAIGAIGQSAVNSNINASIENSVAQSMAQAQQQGAANLNASAAAKQTASDAEFETAIINSQNAGAQRASNFVNQSADYRHQGNILGSRHLQQMHGIQQSVSDSFAAGIARGEASYLANRKNIPSEQISYSFRGNELSGIPGYPSIESSFNLFGDSRQNMFGSTVFDKTGSAFGLINTIGESRGLVNAVNVLDQASNIPSIAAKSKAISLSGSVSSALSNVKGGQAYTILSDTLESTRNLKTVGKVLPWIYGAAQVGEEVQFAIDNNLGFEQSTVNVTTRIAGTVVEVAAGAAVIANTTAAGAAIGTVIFPGVGTVIGGAIGAVVGTVTYGFTDWLPGVDNSVGTSINNAVTNTSREVIGWFQ